MSRESIPHLCHEDIWVAFSMPGSKDYCFFIGQEVDSYSDGACFMLQGWNRTRDERLYIRPQNIQHNTAWQYMVQDICHLSSSLRPDYESMIQRTVDALRAKDFEKAVISKIKVVSREEQDTCELYRALHRTYPQAFTFMYNIPGKGTWCGASPEILLTAEGECLKTCLLYTSPSPRD